MKNKNKNTRAFKGVWIDSKVWLDKDMNLVEKCLYTEIASLDNDGHCFASNKYLSEFLGCSVSKITRGIKKLKDLGLIKDFGFKDGKRLLGICDEGPSAKSRGTLSKKPRVPQQKAEHINIVNNKENNTPSSSPSASPLTSQFFPEKQNQWDHKTKVELLDILRKANPSLVDFYKRKTTWEVIDKLFKTYGVEDSMQLAQLAVFSFGKKYAPPISTPQDLFAKAAKLLDWAKKEKESSTTSTNYAGQLEKMINK